MTQPKKIDYKIHRECSRQWRSLLSAMAQEQAEIPQDSEPQALMHRIGVRFASQSSLPACSDMDALQQAICARWQTMDWGWIELEEEGGKLRIVHHCATNGDLLAGAFGEATEAWVPAFLGGVYQQWLSTLGAGNQLRVRQVTGIDEFGTTELELSI